MKFFIDFEATQFSNRIISIGCVCENGNTFSTLVKPSKAKDKVTKFITALTGITNEMLKDAPSADEAFNNFFDFVIANSNHNIPEYFCYGNGDKEFIGSTVKYMKNIKAITFATSIQHTLIDYSKTVKQAFGFANEISLKKIYTMIAEKEIVQHHDALEDAQMLCDVALNLKDKYSQEEIDKLNALKVSTNKPTIGANKTKKAPAIWYTWDNVLKEDKFSTVTDATPTDHRFVGVCGGHKMYFNSFETAAVWLIRFGFVANRSPKDESHIIGMANKISKGINTDKVIYNFKWYSKKGENK